tara:strand:+ start:2053 stop:2382 length:330 start_codon:yes stop_codon:yes gene_type:complete
MDDKFLNRIKKSACDYIDLKDEEANLYQGSGWAIAHTNSGLIKELVYLTDNGCLDEDNAKNEINKALETGEAYLGMCSAYQFCDPVPINSYNSTTAAKIMRLVGEQMLT